jgi:PAS domain S-box-containing protein
LSRCSASRRASGWRTRGAGRGRFIPRTATGSWRRCPSSARDDREIWVRHEASKVFDEAGRPQFTQGVILDITDRKRAEFARLESEVLFEELFNHVAEAVLVAAAKDGRILDANRSASELTGWTRQDLVSKSLADLLPDDRARLGSGGRNGEHPDFISVKVRTSAGDAVPARLHTSFMRMGDVTGHLLIIQPTK